MKIKLHSLAHARAGDKGDVSMISVIAYRQADFPLLQSQLTIARLENHFAKLEPSRIERFEVPTLGALNIVLHGALRGGVTRSLARDAHGKTLSSCLLELDLEVPPNHELEEGRAV
jgi:hypothetical protein